MLSRRHILSASVAAVAIAALPVIDQADDAGQFRAWQQQSRAAWKKANKPTGSEEHTRRWCTKANDLDTLIMDTPARSREAVLIKLETMERVATENLDDAYALGLAQVRVFILNGGLS